MTQLTRDQIATASQAKYTRTLTLDVRAANAELRSVPAALSSAVELSRGYFTEKLVHSAEAIDLTRARDGLPLLFNHNRDLPIGIVTNIRIEDQVLRGDLVFSDNAKAREVWGDVQGEFLRDVSIGYFWQRWEESADSDLITVTRWELFEASIVTIPADPSVGVGRDLNLNQPADPGQFKRAQAMEKTGQNNGQVIEFQAAREAGKAEGVAEGMRIEAERRSGIEAAFRMPRFQGAQFDSLRQTALDNLWSVDQARAALLELIGQGGAGALGGGAGFTQSESRHAPAGGFDASRMPHVMPGEDVTEAWARGVELAIMVRAGIETDTKRVAEARGGEFTGMSLSEITRDYCRVRNINVRGMSRDRVVAAAFATRATGVIGYAAGDFTGLLENIANKSMLLGYNEAPELWPMIARAGTLPDFKQSSRPGMSEFDDLDIIRENGEYKLARPGDRTEKITLLTFGKLFRLGRVAIVNDDLDAFTMIPRKMGRAAKRAIGDQVFNVLTLNPTMGQDSIALFHASHNNLISAGSGAPSVAQLNTMKAAMGKQKDSANVVNGLNIRLSRVVVPLALEGVARTLAESQQDPATGVSAGTPNIHRGTFEVVPDARLDTVSSTIWYGLADPNLYDVIEVAFLDGQQEPYLETQDGWTIDGVEYKVRIDCAAIPLEFRTMQRNNG